MAWNDYDDSFEQQFASYYGQPLSQLAATHPTETQYGMDFYNPDTQAWEKEVLQQGSQFDPNAVLSVLYGGNSRYGGTAADFRRQMVERLRQDFPQLTEAQIDRVALDQAMQHWNTHDTRYTTLSDPLSISEGIARGVLGQYGLADSEAGRRWSQFYASPDWAKYKSDFEGPFTASGQGIQKPLSDSDGQYWQDMATYAAMAAAAGAGFSALGAGTAGAGAAAGGAEAGSLAGLEMGVGAEATGWGSSGAAAGFGGGEAAAAGGVGAFDMGEFAGVEESLNAGNEWVIDPASGDLVPASSLPQGTQATSASSPWYERAWDNVAGKFAKDPLGTLIHGANLVGGVASLFQGGPKLSGGAGAVSGAGGGNSAPLQPLMMQRQQTPFTGDFSTYGQPGGGTGHQFFTPWAYKPNATSPLQSILSANRPPTQAPQQFKRGGVAGLKSELMGAAEEAVGPLRASAERFLRGPGGGMDDLIDAKVSPGEYVFDAHTVADLGDGNPEEGARRLDAMREKLRLHKRGSKKLPPKAKNPLEYLK